MELRPYQQDLINKIRVQLMNGRRSVVAVLGCGGGKSVIQASIAKAATDKGNRVLFLVHRRELCQQIADTFVKIGVDLNLCDIAMVQTVSRRLGNTQKEYSVIITDECHHALSSSYKKIYEYYPNAIRLGFTATPVRLNQGGLGEIFEAMVEGVSTKWLIENKFLSPYTYYSVKLAETKDLRVRAGEFVASDVNELMEKNNIYGEAYETWKRLAENKKTIIYCASIKASKETAERFKAEGVYAEHLDGESNALFRRNVIEDFRNGKIKVLCNVDLFGEGFDVPDCECVVLLRPTMSLTLHIQQSMRSMRYKENKNALIIDHVGNVYRHGLPDDVRYWDLKSKKKKQQTEVFVKQCPVCFACIRSSAKVCDKCGYEFSTETVRSDNETVSAQLQEITEEDLLAVKPYEYYKELKTWDDMEKFRKSKNYKFMWSLRKCLELKIKIPSKYNYMVERFIR